MKKPAASKRSPAKPSFKKAPEALVGRFRQLMPRYPQAEVRLMFGYPCAFVGGNMATGLYEDQWFVRLTEADRAALLGIPGAHALEPMPGRPMREHVVLPPVILGDAAKLRSYVEKALHYTGTLPPKKKLASKARA